MVLFNRFLLVIVVLAAASCGGARFGTALFYDGGAGAGDALVDVDAAGDGDLNSSYLDSSSGHEGDVLEHEPEASDDSHSVGPDAGEVLVDAAPPVVDAGPPPPPPVCCWDPAPDAAGAASHACSIVVVSSTYTSKCQDGVACVWLASGSAFQGVAAACP